MLFRNGRPEDLCKEIAAAEVTRLFRKDELLRVPIMISRAIELEVRDSRELVLPNDIESLVTSAATCVL